MAACSGTEMLCSCWNLCLLMWLLVVRFVSMCETMQVFCVNPEWIGKARRKPPSVAVWAAVFAPGRSGKKNSLKSSSQGSTVLWWTLMLSGNSCQSSATRNDGLWYQKQNCWPVASQLSTASDRKFQCYYTSVGWTPIWFAVTLLHLSVEIVTMHLLRSNPSCVSLRWPTIFGLGGLIRFFGRPTWPTRCALLWPEPWPPKLCSEQVEHSRTGRAMAISGMLLFIRVVTLGHLSCFTMEMPGMQSNLCLLRSSTMLWPSPSAPICHTKAKKLAEQPWARLWSCGWRRLCFSSKLRLSRKRIAFMLLAWLKSIESCWRNGCKMQKRQFHRWFWIVWSLFLSVKMALVSWDKKGRQMPQLTTCRCNKMKQCLRWNRRWKTSTKKKLMWAPRLCPCWRKLMHSKRPALARYQSSLLHWWEMILRWLIILVVNVFCNFVMKSRKPVGNYLLPMLAGSWSWSWEMLSWASRVGCYHRSRRRKSWVRPMQNLDVLRSICSSLVARSRWVCLTGRFGRWPNPSFGDTGRLAIYSIARKHCRRENGRRVCCCERRVAKRRSFVFLFEKKLFEHWGYLVMDAAYEVILCWWRYASDNYQPGGIDAACEFDTVLMTGLVTSDND